jgi:hypothetical protein
MTAAPPHPDTKGQRAKMARSGGVALGALVALAVAALFLVLPGADRNDRAPEGYSTRANQIEIPAAPAAPPRRGPQPDRPSRAEPPKRSGDTCANPDGTGRPNPARDGSGAATRSSGQNQSRVASTFERASLETRHEHLSRQSATRSAASLAVRHIRNGTRLRATFVWAARWSQRSILITRSRPAATGAMSPQQNPAAGPASARRAPEGGVKARGMARATPLVIRGCRCQLWTA